MKPQRDTEVLNHYSISALRTRLRRERKQMTQGGWSVQSISQGEGGSETYSLVHDNGDWTSERRFVIWSLPYFIAFRHGRYVRVTFHPADHDMLVVSSIGGRFIAEGTGTAVDLCEGVYER